MTSFLFCTVATCFALAAVVSSGAPTCNPVRIPLVPGTIRASSQDLLYQAGDIHYRNCSQTAGTRKYIGWCPDPHDKSPWVQVHLSHAMAIHELVFQTALVECASSQHDFSMEAFMETFDLQYVIPGDADENLVDFAEDVPALDGFSSEKVFQFSEPLVTASIKIVPKSFSLYGCFRFMIRGCEPDSMCTQGWCLNGGKCSGSNYCTCASGFYGERCNQTAQSVVKQDYSFMEIKDNILTTPDATFKVNGDVTLVENRRRSGHHHGHSCHFSSHNSHPCYIEHQSHSSHQSSSSNHGHHDSHHDNHCMANLNNHHSGFTTTMNVHFGHNHHGNCHLYSNGGNLHGHNGASLSYHNNHLNFHVSTHTHHWHVSHPCNLTPGTTHSITTSWHPHTGAQIHVNNQQVASSSHCTPHATVANQTVPLRIANGHVTINVNVNMNLTISGLNMYSLDMHNLANLNISVAPQATPTPSGPFTAAPQTTPAIVSATTTHDVTTTTHAVTTTASPTITTADTHRPMCFSYSGQPSIGSSTNKVRCNLGEVCSIFYDDTGYTAKCLVKNVCEAAKRVAGNKCFECCETYLCNSHCSASTTTSCSDTPECAVMIATGYDVCNDQDMSLNYCSKTCKICS